jgi:hypothetical protein
LRVPALLVGIATRFEETPANRTRKSTSVRLGADV